MESQVNTGMSGSIVSVQTIQTTATKYLQIKLTIKSDAIGLLL